MAENQNKSDIVDTTDCLEAVNTFKSMKNFLFVVILICLILVQAVFWLSKLGFVDKAPCSSTICVQSENPALTTLDVPLEESAPPVIDKEVQEEVKKAADEVTTQTAAEDTPETTIVIDATVEEPAKKGPSIPMPKACCLAMVVKICNFILIMAAALYSLTLLMTIKISLCGRLGGLSHISKAFFASLFALVILIPWQALLPGVLVGAIYTPAELFAPVDSSCIPAMIADILYYIRFPGMWGLVTLLFISAQSRSAKWAKTILRRLGILH